MLLNTIWGFQPMNFVWSHCCKTWLLTLRIVYNMYHLGSFYKLLQNRQGTKTKLMSDERKYLGQLEPIFQRIPRKGAKNLCAFEYRIFFNCWIFVALPLQNAINNFMYCVQYVWPSSFVVTFVFTSKNMKWQKEMKWKRRKEAHAFPKHTSLVMRGLILPFPSVSLTGSIIKKATADGEGGG